MSCDLYRLIISLMHENFRMFRKLNQENIYFINII